jgi:hypothetical protein
MRVERHHRYTICVRKFYYSQKLSKRSGVVKATQTGKKFRCITILIELWDEERRLWIYASAKKSRNVGVFHFPPDFNFSCKGLRVKWSMIVTQIDWNKPRVGFLAWAAWQQPCNHSTGQQIQYQRHPLQEFRVRLKSLAVTLPNHNFGTVLHRHWLAVA